MSGSKEIIWFEKAGRGDVALVGGKNASLGEMVQTLSAKGIRVPPGFATTAEAYWRFVDENVIRSRTTDFLKAYAKGSMTLAETGHAIRSAFLHGEWPADSQAGNRRRNDAQTNRRPEGARRNALGSRILRRRRPDGDGVEQNTFARHLRSRRRIRHAKLGRPDARYHLCVDDFTR